MGGSEVHLLLEIKNTKLDPIWIKTLPSGVAVYQSVFKDIWGSELIFAGPHKTFTTGNKTSNINHVIFGIHSVIGEHEGEDESWTDNQLSDHPCVLGVICNNDQVNDINPGAEIEVNRDDQTYRLK